MRLEEAMPPALASYLLRKALEPDAFELAGRGVYREPRQKLLQVTAALSGAALRIGGHRDDQVGALEADRIVAWAEEEALDDPRELHVRRTVLGQVGEETPERLIVLAEAAIDHDQAEVVLGVEEVMEALGEE